MKQFAKPFLSIMLLFSIAVALPNFGNVEGAPDDFVPQDEPAADAGATNTANTAGTKQTTETVTGTTGTGTTGTGTGSEARAGSDRHCRERFACGSTLFLPQPQGLNEARFFNPFWYGPNTGDRCFYFDIGYRYRQSRHNKRIAECLFGSENVVFAGSKADHKKGEILADNLGLSPNFRGTLHLDPVVRDHMIDIDTRFELGGMMECLEGAYAQFRATVVNTQWRLGECEKNHSVHDAKNSNFAPGEVSKGEAVATNSILTALSGDFLFGDQQEIWRAGRFTRRREDRRDTKLANIDLILGYDFLLCDDYHFGAYIKGVAPTGTKPDAREVFQPIAGNGHHWELGGGITAHYELWNCDDQSLAAYLNGCVTHLFKDEQWRTFQFRRTTHGESCWSQYTLLKELDKENKYTGHLVPGVNFLTRHVKSSFAVQGDAAFRLLYRSCGWAVGLGYSIYGRSHEKIENICGERCSNLADRHFGIKGITPAWNKDGTQTGTGNTGTGSFTPNSETQNTFRIKGQVFEQTDREARQVHCPRDFKLGGSEGRKGARHSDQKDTTTKVENHQVDGTETGTGTGTGTVEGSEGRRDHGRHRGIPSQISHKVFGHIDYICEDWDCGSPYMGIGAEGIFANNGKCHVCTPSFWGVWFRIGMNY